jgi:16S rRNA (uracil1498-N3)-methyltransferase
MRRFFVEDIDIESGFVDISGPELRHLRDVLRLGKGSELKLFNGKGLVVNAVIDTINEEAAKARILAGVESDAESSLKLILLQALIKGDKPELVVQKATELGVSEVIFYPAHRSVVKLGEDKIAKKLERLNRVALEAAKQCGRGLVPRVDFLKFEEAIQANADALKMALYECEEDSLIKDVLKNFDAANGVVLLIGPEGGLTDEEVATIKKADFKTVGIGPRILKSETAAIAAITIIQYELGDMGKAYGEAYVEANGEAADNE